MKPPQLIVSVILCIVAVVLASVTLVQVINIISLGDKNQSLQAQLQTQQEQINKGNMTQQVGVTLLKEIAAASVKDEALKDVLAKSGYSVTVNASPTPTP
jgi:predicted Holliday junction resolvase-like endonuclease